MQGFAGGNGNFEEYWKQSSFSYKCCCLTSTIIFAFSMFVPALIILFIDIPELTIWSFHIWRIFVCMFAQTPSLMSILSIVFSFMWLYNILKDSEYSTVHKLIEIFLINFEIHLVFNIICLLFTIIFNTKQSLIFYGYGWFPIIIIYQFRNSITNPEQDRRFCCLPFLIKNKYYPWVLVVLLGIFSAQFFCFVACAILGYYQEVVRKDMFIKLPLWVYKKLQAIIPEQVKNRPDFVPISAVQGMLKTKCYKATQSRQVDQPHENNPYAYNSSQYQAQANNQNAQQIGGGQPVDFKSYWAQKDLDSGTKTNSKSNSNANADIQIQIQPKTNTNTNTNYNNTYNNYNQQNQNPYGNDNNSYARFNDDIPHDKELLDDNQERSDSIKKNGKRQKGQKDIGSDLI